MHTGYHGIYIDDEEYFSPSGSETSLTAVDSVVSLADWKFDPIDSDSDMENTYPEDNDAAHRPLIITSTPKRNMETALAFVKEEQ